MALSERFNRFIDLAARLTLLVAAFTLALVPVAYIFGHQMLHHQSYNEAFERHQPRAQELKSLTTLGVSNIYLKPKGALTAQDITQTHLLADWICYQLKVQGEAVVRKNLELKPKKLKKKKGKHVEVPALIKTVTTLHEEPPLTQLKKKISKYIDFQDETLNSKHWVLVTPTQLDTHFASEIEALIIKNPGYKFIVVSPRPLKHFIFKHNQTDGVTTNSVTEEDVDDEAAEVEETEPKKPKKAKKSKAKKVKVQVQVKDEAKADDNEDTQAQSETVAQVIQVPVTAKETVADQTQEL